MDKISENTASQPILEGVIARLKCARGSVARIARETGVNANAISRISRGVNKNPCIQTLQPLVDWFNAHPIYRPIEPFVIHRATGPSARK